MSLHFHFSFHPFFAAVFNQNCEVHRLPIQSQKFGKADMYISCSMLQQDLFIVNCNGLLFLFGMYSIMIIDILSLSG